MSPAEVHAVEGTLTKITNAVAGTLTRIMNAVEITIKTEKTRLLLSHGEETATY